MKISPYFAEKQSMVITKVKSLAVVSVLVVVSQKKIFFMTYLPCISELQNNKCVKKGKSVPLQARGAQMVPES